MTQPKIIERSTARVKGTWSYWSSGGDRNIVHITCPDCGKTYPLSEHEIKYDGTVQPSLACPSVGCSFHEYVQLKDYIEDEMDDYDADECEEEYRGN